MCSSFPKFLKTLMPAALAASVLVSLPVSAKVLQSKVNYEPSVSHELSNNLAQMIGHQLAENVNSDNKAPNPDRHATWDGEALDWLIECLRGWPTWPWG